MAIGLFGAFERHNFGDWLMAYIAESLLTEESVWLYDTQTLGFATGPDCGNFQQVEKFVVTESNPRIIHTGGETLGVSTQTAMSSNGNTISRSIRNNFYVLPQSLHGKEISRSFFGIGGAFALEGQEDLAYIIEALGTAKWVSVRESSTAERLNHIGIYPSVIPDLVSLLPIVYNARESRERSGALFQLSEAFLNSNFLESANLLTRLLKEFSEVRVIAAGVAPGHDSWQLYAKLISFVRQSSRGNLRLVTSLDPLDIVDEIISSEIVVASSLHIRIVAMGFAVPRVSLFSQKTKLYAREWDIYESCSESSSCAFEMVEEAISAHRKDLQAVARSLIERTKSGWEDMVSGF